MWKYSQTTGNLYINGDDVPIAVGYSGFGQGKDNPDLQDVHNVGPIPVGLYNIGPAYDHPELGPVVMNLEPTITTNTFGRSEFRIHGDSKEHPGSASHGCIILPRSIRDWIAQRGGQIEVVS